MRSIVYIAIIAFLAIGVMSDEDATKDNKTDAKPEPAEKPKTDEEPLICKKCECKRTNKNPEVMCAYQNLEGFSKDDWVALNTSMPEVEIINFSDNDVETLTAFPLMLNVREVNFHHNNIKQIENKAFINLPKLERLNLSWNKLKAEDLKPEVFQGNYNPDVFEPLKNLKELDLSNNDIHTLNIDVFEHLVFLESLKLANNPFKIIDSATREAFKSLTRLKTLDLSDMMLETLPNDFLHGLTELETLNLTGNLLKTIPETLPLADNLRTLILDDNPIEKIGGDSKSVFPKLKNLEILSITDLHEIKEIGEGAFSNLPNLNTLHCASNYVLSSIHPNAFSVKSEDGKVSWPPLTRLYLAHNNLSVLDPQLLGNWYQLSVLDLEWNNWLCDCSNDFLINTLTPMIEKKTPEFVDEMTCDHPKELAAKKLVDVSHHKELLDCESVFITKDRFFVGILTGILLCLVVAIPLIFIYQRGYFPFFRSRNPSAAAYSRQYYSPARDDQFEV